MVSIFMASVSPWNSCVILLCVMFGFMSSATPELWLPVLCMYVMYGCMFMCLLGGAMLVCANSMMSGLSSVYICCNASFLPIQPFMFWNITLSFYHDVLRVYPLCYLVS